MLGIAALLALISNHVQTVCGAAFFSLASNRSYRLKDGSALPLNRKVRRVWVDSVWFNCVQLFEQSRVYFE
jgi:hypothetical protein